MCACLCWAWPRRGPGAGSGVSCAHTKCELCSSPCLSYNRCSVNKTMFWTLGSWPEFLKRTLLWVCLCSQPSAWPPRAWPEESGMLSRPRPALLRGSEASWCFPAARVMLHEHRQLRLVFLSSCV